jgi:hypothetical protein
MCITLVRKFWEAGNSCLVWFDILNSKQKTMNSKVILAAIAGGLTFFLLGWLIYGVLFADSMESGMSENAISVMREEPVIWGYGIANLAMGLFLALVYNGMGKKTFMKGAVAGIWIGILWAIGMDFSMYAGMDLFPLSIIPMDVGMTAVLTGISGGVIGWVLGTGAKTAAA